MKLLITLISIFLLMIQMPIQAEEGHSDLPKPTTMSIDNLNILINNHETSLQSNDYDKIMSSANTLLDTYKNTNDPELKGKITEALLMINDGNRSTFLDYALWNNRSEIIKTTIDALKDNPVILEELLLVSYNNGPTYFQLATYQGKSEIINTTINALKDRHKKLLEKMLMATDKKYGYTYLQVAAYQGKSEIIKTTIDALKDKHKKLLEKMLMATDEEYGYTYLHMAAYQGKSEIIKTTIEALKDRPEILHKILIARNVKGLTFLHIAGTEGKSDIIKTTIDNLKYNPSMLADLLMKVDFTERFTYLHWAIQIGNTEIINTTIDALKVNHKNMLLDLLMFRYKLMPKGFKPSVLQMVTSNNNTEIFKKTIDVFRESSDMLEKMLMAWSSNGYTYLHYAASSGKSDIIKTIVDVLKVDHKNILQKLLMARNTDKRRTFLHGATLKNQSYSGIIKTTIDILKLDHKNMLQKLLMARDVNGLTFLHEATLQGQNNIIQTTIDALNESPDMLEKLLSASDGKDNSFLHVALTEGKIDTIMTTIDALINYPDLLEILLEGENKEAYIKKAVDLITNNYKSALKIRYAHDVLSYANDLLGTYKITNDTELKGKITEALFMKDSENRIFLHYALGDVNEIINTTIDALKESPDILQKLLISKNNDERTFLQVAANNGEVNIIQRTIDALKNQPEILKKLLGDENKEAYIKKAVESITNHYEYSLERYDFESIFSSANALVDIYKNTSDPELRGKITEALLMIDSDQFTFLRYAAIKGKSDIIKTTIDTLKERPDILEKLLTAVDGQGNLFLHVAALNNNSDIIASTINALKDNPDILTYLLNLKNDKGSTVKDLMPKIDYPK